MSVHLYRTMNPRSLFAVDRIRMSGVLNCNALLFDGFGYCLHIDFGRTKWPTR